MTQRALSLKTYEIYEDMKETMKGIWKYTKRKKEEEKKKLKLVRKGKEKTIKREI